MFIMNGMYQRPVDGVDIHAVTTNNDFQTNHKHNEITVNCPDVNDGWGIKETPVNCFKN